ncbi:MAG: hypothetical protein FJX18_02575 [Alphaproteobacteria bacterium]|nr:hypothetical protein [Alphaproteobacteria bacterium]
MKRLLVAIFLCFMATPKDSSGGFFSWAHDVVYGPEKAARTVASSRKIDPDMAAPNPSTYSTARQAIYTVAHLAVTGFMAYGFGDFVSYGMGTPAGVFVGIVTAIGFAGNEVLPASLLTRLTNKALPLSDRVTEGALTAAGTIVALTFLPGETAVWSAQRDDSDFCLRSNKPRYAHAIFAGILMAINVGHSAAKRSMRTSRKGTTLGDKIWNLGGSIAEIVPYLTAPILFIYAKRGGDSFFGPECLEATRDSDPSIRTNPVGFMGALEDTFPFALWSGGAAAMLVPVWFGHAAKDTVALTRYVVEKRDPVVGTALAVSAVATSLFVNALMPHLWDYGLRQLSCAAFPAEGAATILGLTLAQATRTAPNLFPSLPYNLTVFGIQQVQAFGAMHPIGLTPALPSVQEIITGALPSTQSNPSAHLKTSVGFLLYPTAILSASFFAKGIANILRTAGWNRKALDKYSGTSHIEDLRSLMSVDDLNRLDGLMAVPNIPAPPPQPQTTVNPMYSGDPA